VTNKKFYTLDMESINIKKTCLWIVLCAIILIGFFIYKELSNIEKSDSLTIIYPIDQTVFPKDMVAPEFAWKDDNLNVKKWKITVKTEESIIIKRLEVFQNSWIPSEEEWNSILASGTDIQYTFTIYGEDNSRYSTASMMFYISSDPVDAAIFFRSVPLPFKFARENLKRVKWHLGDVSSYSRPHVILQSLPVCANCHSFSKDGRTLGMDVDAMDDKGAYAISSFDESTKFASDSIISWSNYQNGKFTYGLLSQISPDGRYVVSTLHDCEIFIDRDDLEYSQLFFPFKGILVVYDREEKRYFELPGANDTMFVQSNPTWTPDGKNILFARARAKHYNESGIHNGSVPIKSRDKERFEKFVKTYTDRDSLFKFDIYTIPFNNGKGGKATPIEGASNNGLSNYFPRVSPDGKWIVFCQAESFMLLQKDSKLLIAPMAGGKPRILNCNTNNMNSWHSWSPNSKWLIFSSKSYGPYTQLYLTHINEDGSDTPPVFLNNFSFSNYANNIPEFVNTKYNKNLKITPEFLSADDFTIRKGEIFQNSGNVQRAFEEFDKAVKKFPKNSEAYYKRGRIFLQRNQFHEALKDLNNALELSKNPNYYVTRGIIKIKIGDNQAAIKDLNNALKKDSSNNNAISYLGVAYIQTDKPDVAISYLKKAVELDKQDYYSYYYLGLAYYNKRKYKEAQLSFTSGIQYCTDHSLYPVIYEMRGKSFARLNNFKTAINDFDYAIKCSPNNPSPYYEKGKALLEIRQYQEAMYNLKKAEQLGSQQASSLLRTIIN
jgi:tetratricopeptide (TPR) repeat protein